MDKTFVFLVLLANLLVLKCQEEEPIAGQDETPTSTGNPNYSFSYGVADGSTGDVKAVWEEKDGDTVKGHYSVLEPDGSMRTVEYSANPKTGFQAVVNNDGVQLEEQSVGRAMEDKAMRDYGRYSDFNEDPEFDSYLPLPYEKKKSKHPIDTVFKDYSAKKRPKYPIDLESSEFSHSVTIKHPRDETGAFSESHSHFGLDLDPNCKTKHKKTINNNLYTNVGDELKYPIFNKDPFKDNFEKFEPSNIDFEKLNPYGLGDVPRLKAPPVDYEKFISPYSIDQFASLEDFKSKYKYPYIPDIPTPESLYPDDLPLRPKKKYRPHKNPEFYQNEDHDEYWVPKKKKKLPPRYEPDYYPEAEEEYDRPRYPNDSDDDDRPPRNPSREKGPKKEVVRKIVKKRKPGFNLLDILDI